MDLGGGYLDQDGTEDEQHINAYAYAQVNARPNVVGTLGVSFDAFAQAPPAPVDVNRINPKFGIMWDVSPSTTLRAAAFSTVKRPLAANQTVEPTQVAGFNQFFDDIDGTKTWRYGIGADHIFSATLFGGIELSWRDLEVPCLCVGSPSVSLEDQQEQFHRAYLYWTPAARWALSAEADLEEFQSAGLNADPSFPVEVMTRRIPIAAKYYHPNGLFARLGVTYVDQAVAFQPEFPETQASTDDERFWVADASVGYRLPKRWGIFTLDVANVFDQDFRYEDANFQIGEPRIPIFQPERQIFARFTASF